MRLLTFRCMLLPLSVCIHASQFGYSNRVIGGKKTTIENFPYQLSLEIEQVHTCGASLIKPNVIVTAAHCIVSDCVENVTVRAGSTFKEEGGHVKKLIKLIQHPKYSAVHNDYDVAVGMLESPFQLSSVIEPISLQCKSCKIKPGTLAYVTGWGNIVESEWDTGPKTLRVALVPKMGYTKCKELYHPFTFTHRMTCFGYKKGKKDACYGDSGGPLMINGELVGIVSWGDGCGRRNKPGVYTDISNPEIHEFINKYIN